MAAVVSFFILSPLRRSGRALLPTSFWIKLNRPARDVYRIIRYGIMKRLMISRVPTQLIYSMRADHYISNQIVSLVNGIVV